MQLRYLQTLTQIAGDKTSTIVFPDADGRPRPAAAEAQRTLKNKRPGERLRTRPADPPPQRMLPGHTLPGQLLSRP